LAFQRPTTQATTGFLNFLENEAELAGVLGHELGHLQYKDKRLKQSSGKSAMDGIKIAAAITAPFFGIFGMLGILGLVGLEALTGKSEVPDATVRKADKQALNMMQAAGYDPQAWLDVLDRLLKSQQEEVFFMLDYHNSRPLTAKRLESLQKEFRELNFTDQDLHTYRTKYVDATRGTRSMYGRAVA